MPRKREKLVLNLQFENSVNGGLQSGLWFFYFKIKVIFQER